MYRHTPLNASNTFEAVFYRTYSRRLKDGSRETWEQATDRAIGGLQEIGKFSPNQLSMISAAAQNLSVLPSGRWMWVGGTEWIKNKENFIGAYNCSSLNLDDIKVFGMMMNMAMMGTGTGAVLEEKYISKLPKIVQKMNVTMIGEFGANIFPKELTELLVYGDGSVLITVGDSRRGWVDAYQSLINLSTMVTIDMLQVTVDVSNVRKKGKKLKGFGGVANPDTLPDLFPKVAKILNKCADRDGRLTAVECCLLIDEASLVVVAGNVRRSAGMRQGGSDDKDFAEAKDNLWVEGKDGKWRIDPERDALRMANHTRVYHHHPTLDEVKLAVTKQFRSGEGAIQFAPEAIARGSADLLTSRTMKNNFIKIYAENQDKGREFLNKISLGENDRQLDHRMSRYGLNPCFVAGTMVMTREGHFPIENLVGKIVDVWDGENWVTIDNFRVTGENQQVTTLTMNGGESMTATPYHTFILENGDERQLKNLKVGDRLLTHNINIHGTHPTETAIDKSLMNTIASIEDAGVADKVYCCTVPTNNRFSLTNSFVSGNCAEVLGSAFLCNLSEIHLKTLDPWCLDSQIDAFRVGGWIVAALLHHEFEEEIQQYSREIDPIVGVSFTGLFDFFVNAFGLPWLQWWEDGRTTGFNVDSTELAKLIALLPNEWIDDLHLISEPIRAGTLFFFAERKFLTMWKRAAHNAVDEYCDEHKLTRPNRTTVVQPAGTKSLLTGSSPGWHPPKGANYIRRITFSAHDPLALTLRDAGYKIIPGQTDKDETGALLDDPMDERCTEWLVEIPVQTSAGLIAGAGNIDFNKFSAVAQLDFYMQVQNHYAEHTTSATIELREDEIDRFSEMLYTWIGRGFMSAALLARFDSPFPRLPFEVVSGLAYADEMNGVEARRRIPINAIYDRLAEYDNPNIQLDGPAQCDSGWCDNKK